ncbi:tRNA (guanosine(37)-N1)-methyltransferase TrmD [Candidatus Contubernalis alkaliaceticus]|uniref:tRNA (guanosine(37)-N1)-methyltransferase TrmD n=1 Tax=Candidatus Contubernalis alkaliaceticus TaxID=338645 RepID=UPI001F4BECDE|nr:tRNA (guanosine(37)-N1)-methyltransferase TrmD [Candidatus Contubernalis alkalaceticus]UNC92742.1 tRNA (guanosine(37)-N1)-methyltransferase TrmD [Candidatus Contubernalis alkalaceticus]
MRIDIITLFPEMFQGPFDSSIIKRARDQNRVQLNLVNLRDYSRQKHRQVDDYPYGGGKGMLIKPEPVFEAVESLLSQQEKPRVILLCPQGEPFDQKKAVDLASMSQLILICGHYEGVDQRVKDHLVDEEISIGDYVLTGGEIPAMVITDAVIRLLPGVLSSKESVQEESFFDHLLEYPQYTRPELFRSLQVPQILLSGNHENIRLWRRKQALVMTFKKRPDLLQKVSLNPEDKEILQELFTETK